MVGTGEPGGAEAAWQSIRSLAEIRQGDILRLARIPILGTHSCSVSAPHGVVVISQTCDIVNSDRPNLIVAVLSEVEEHNRKAAQQQMMPRYVGLPSESEPDLYADLEFVAAVDKGKIADIEYKKGIDPKASENVRAFALSVGRRFSRFPFPDEVVPWLAPLQGIVKDKVDKTSSPIGRLLEHVAEFRVESTDWHLPPFEITLHIITRAGAVPTLDENEITASVGIDRWLHPKGGNSRRLDEIAERLFPDHAGNEIGLSSADRHSLWLAFGEALASRCQPKGKDLMRPVVLNAVGSIQGVISPEDEFTLVQFRRSESLDLDHLSAPGP